MNRFLPLWPLLFLAACTTTPDRTTLPPQFTATAFADLPGWQADDLSGFAAAMERTCARQAKQKPETPVRPAGTNADWQAFCAAITGPGTDPRAVIETHLRPWRVTIRGSDDGLFTGYYEASLNGSRTQGGPYQTPIRARPLDHVTADLGAFKPELAGQRITGQLTGLPGGLTLTPYPDRAGIENGEIAAKNDRVLAWVDDPVDAFFLEIQGSGRVALDDGGVMHVGYDERNGQAYTAIGKVLIERGELTKENTSMQTIRAWMAADPDQARTLMHENKSYIFFRDIGPNGPLGAENVPLTPLRSMAIDKGVWSYGLPFYIDTAAPNGDPGGLRLQRLMTGQDTGGAIKGAIRGDVFWGYGAMAAEAAGVMKSRGNLWVLLPASLDPRANAQP